MKWWGAVATVLLFALIFLMWGDFRLASYIVTAGHLLLLVPIYKFLGGYISTV